MIKDPKLSDFTVIETPHIRWEELEKVMGKRKYKIFIRWMEGQTSLPDGAYQWDVKRFLDGRPIVD